MEINLSCRAFYFLRGSALRNLISTLAQVAGARTFSK